MSVRISCIIPTCDRPTQLVEAVTSVLDQSRTPDEILIVDNGTSPVSLPPDISAKVKVFRLAARSGASKARNFGAAQSTGDYLAFLDDDDLWTQDYLLNIEAAILNGAQCVLSDIKIVKNNAEVSRKSPAGKLTLANLLVSNPGAVGSNLVIAKTLFDELGGYDPILTTSEDKSLIIELIRAGRDVTVLPNNPIIARYSQQGHLTDPLTIAAGIYHFTHKYKSLMNVRQRVHNRYKIYYYRYHAGQPTAVVPYAIFYLIHKILSI